MEDPIDLASISWPVWWMLGSAGLALLGFIGGQLIKMVVGAKAIARGEADYSVTEEALLSERSANRGFKAFVFQRTQGLLVGRLFFWMFVVGLVLQVAFWVAAATVLDLDAL